MCDGCVMRGCQLCLVKAKSSSLSSPSPSMWSSRGRPGKQGRNSQTFLCDHPPQPWGGLLGLIFAGYVPLASQNPYPIIVYSVAIIVIDLILVTLGKK